jgi:hypothetical protein
LKVSLDGPAAATELSRDLVDRPALSAKSCSFDGSSRWRRLGSFELDDHSDVVAFDGAESAIPSCAHVRVFVPEGQREAGEAGLATVASKEG